MEKIERITEGLAMRLHTQERNLLRIIEETSPCNCVWEDLDERFKKQYRATAELFIDYLDFEEVDIYGRKD